MAARKLPNAAKRNAKAKTQQPAEMTVAKSRTLIKRELQRKRNRLTHDEIAAKLGVPRTRVYWTNRALREAS